MKMMDKLNNTDMIRVMCRRLSAPLVTLLSQEPEIQYVRARGEESEIQLHCDKENFSDRDCVTIVIYVSSCYSARTVGIFPVDRSGNGRVSVFGKNHWLHFQVHCSA